jgi:hypothetical protein
MLESSKSSSVASSTHCKSSRNKAIKIRSSVRRLCANGIANRQASAGDPSVFFVPKGKLYVCVSPEAEKEFQSNAQANVKKADDNWGDAYEWFY